jgi:hypothetical protein
VFTPAAKVAGRFWRCGVWIVLSGLMAVQMGLLSWYGAEIVLCKLSGWRGIRWIERDWWDW